MDMQFVKKHEQEFWNGLSNFRQTFGAVVAELPVVAAAGSGADVTCGCPCPS
jgi:hypothetical protein